MKKHEIILDYEYPPNGRFKRQKQKKTAKQRRTIAMSILLALVLLLVCTYFGVEAWNDLKGTPVFPPDAGAHEVVVPPVTERVTILMLGMDKEGANTDTIMIAILDCETHKVNIMSIPRDTKVVGPKGGFIRINAVYATYKLSGLINVVSEVTGLPINYYMLVDFEAFRKAVDILGGVYFDVPMRLRYSDPYQNLNIDLQKGYQRLNGSQAEQLVRSRNQYDEADIKRTEVQRDFIKAMIGQHAKLENITKLGELFDAVYPYIISNLTYDDVLKYGTQLAGIEDEDINLFMIPGEVNDAEYQRTGVSWFYYYADEMEELARNTFGFKVKVNQGPQPGSGGGSGSGTATATPSSQKPSVVHEPDDDDDDRPALSASPSPSKAPSNSPVPSSAASPTPTPSVLPTAQPATPTPADTDAPIPTNDIDPPPIGGERTSPPGL